MTLAQALSEFDDDKEVVYRDRAYPRPGIVRKVEATRQEGSVRKIKADRGFGFIAGDDGLDYFFHWTSMEKTTKNFRDLEIQDRVSFIAIDGEKGPRAILVRVD